MGMQTSVSRRGFVAGAAVGAAGLSIAPGIAPAYAQDESTGQSDTTQVLNEQDYSYTTNSITDFTKTQLFSDWKLGPIELHHRMVKSAAFQLAFFNANPDEYFAYYERMAKGGVEMIWIEDFANFWDMTASPLKQDYDAYDVKGLVAALHADGAYVGYQFDTMGAPIGPLDYTEPFIGNYSTEEIRSWQQVVVDLAKRLQADGFDAIELNMAANNMGQSFLSRTRNNRDDEYGPQSLENRTRWAVETIHAIKEACGPDFVVQALINAIESNDKDLGNDGEFTSIEESKAIAKILEEAGADSLHVRIGPAFTHIAQFAGDLYFCANGLEGMNSHSGRYDFSKHWQGLLRGNHSGCGLGIDMAAEIKSAVSIPVGAATYMDPAQAPDYFEQALEEGKLDFFVMNRPLCVDPEYVNKLREGRIDEIAPCTRCLHCFYDVDHKGTVPFEHCRVNAANWRAYGPVMPEGFDPAPAETPKKVMVIGGGPAGMEAARVAAQRGHAVTLYEKADSLGGTLPVAEAIKGPHENLGRLTTYLARELDVTGVEVVTGTEMTVDDVVAAAPDYVVVATGAIEPMVTWMPTASTMGATLETVPGLECGPEVVVLGSSARAVDTAIYLEKKGKHVTIVTPDPMELFEKGHSGNVQQFIRNAFTANGGTIYANATLIEVGDGFVTITRNDAGVEATVKADAVVDLSDMLPNTELVDAITAAGIDCVAVGDCAEPWNIAEAISTANLAARAI